MVTHALLAGLIVLAQPFTPASNRIVGSDGVKTGGMAIADLNGDGRPEIIIPEGDALAPSDTLLFVWDEAAGEYQDSTPSNAPAMTGTPGVWRSAVTADFNHDGFLDIARAGALSGVAPAGALDVFPGGENLSFGASAFQWQDAGDPDSLALLDYDQDGWVDLLMTGSGMQLFRNPADGTFEFTAVNAATSGLPAWNSEAGDFATVVDLGLNHRVDIFARNDVSADVWKQLENGSFKVEDEAPDFSASPGVHTTVVCDLDNDKDFDAIWVDRGSGPGINEVYERQLGQYFATGVVVVTPEAGDAVESITCADVDNDGLLDLYVVMAGPDIILRNTTTEPGQFEFTPYPTNGIGLGPAADVVFLDYDSDGDLDLVLSQPQLAAMWENTTNNGQGLTVSVKAEAGPCDETAPTMQTAYGASVKLSGGTKNFGIRTIDSGSGRGSHVPMLHYGLGEGLETEYSLSVNFAIRGEPWMHYPVPPGATHYDVQHVRDLDGDGLSNAQENVDGGRLTTETFNGSDFDGDGYPNWLDEDSDGDGIPDRAEANVLSLCEDPADADDDGTPDYLDPFVGPGFAIEGSGCACTLSEPTSSRPGSTAMVLLLLLAAAVLACTRREWPRSSSRT